jgi:hypothetical protein
MKRDDVIAAVIIAGMVAAAVAIPQPLLTPLPYPDPSPRPPPPPPPVIDSTATIPEKADKLEVPHVVRTIPMGKMANFIDAFPPASIFYRPPDAPPAGPAANSPVAVAAPEPDPPAPKDICARTGGVKVTIGRSWHCHYARGRR